MDVLLNDKTQFTVDNDLTDVKLKYLIFKELGLTPNEYYLLSNGKRIQEPSNIGIGTVHVIPRILGGKGGFGSMLRAIGAQIEKTTNREACRDLSGRRLRDINEEQRLKNWIDQQAEREKEAKERKQKKLERFCELPKHEFKDEQYDKERSELPEIVEDAVLKGLQASCNTKRKITDTKTAVKKKKARLWVDEDLDDDLSSSEDEGGDSEESKSSTGSVLKNTESDGCTTVKNKQIQDVEDETISKTTDSDKCPSLNEHNKRTEGEMMSKTTDSDDCPSSDNSNERNQQVGSEAIKILVNEEKIESTEEKTRKERN